MPDGQTADYGFFQAAIIGPGAQSALVTTRDGPFLWDFDESILRLPPEYGRILLISGSTCLCCSPDATLTTIPFPMSPPKPSPAEIQMHIVYLRSGPMILSKKSYHSWREIQDEYDDFMTSLGPWSADAVADFIEDEYPMNPPFTRTQIDAFVKSDDVTLSSTA